jgi:hypothetical protein
MPRKSSTRTSRERSDRAACLRQAFKVRGKDRVGGKGVQRLRRDLLRFEQRLDALPCQDAMGNRVHRIEPYRSGEKPRLT